MSVPLVRRNLLHERGKLLLSVAGIGAALSLILVLLGFRRGLYATLTAFADHLGADLIVAQTGVKGILSSDSALPLSLHGEAVAASGASEAGHILVADIIFTEKDTKTPVLLVGYDPQSGFGAPWRVGTGRALRSDGEIMLDAWLASRSGLQVGDQVEVLGQRFEIAGLTLDTSSWMSPYIFVTLPAAEHALATHGLVSYHLLRLAEDGDPSQAAREIERRIPGVQALTPEQIAEADRRVMASIMDTPISVMLVIAGIIAATVMGLTSYSAVADRLREYAVLQAIGAEVQWLRRLVIRETAWRSLLGFLAGAGLAQLSAQAIMALWPQFNLVLETEALVIAGLLMLLLTVPAALIPIRRIGRLDPTLAFEAR